MGAFGEYQNEIYLDGLGGVMPRFPMTFEGWEERARAAMSPSVWSYVAGGPATSTRSARTWPRSPATA